ncbi:MAG: hypothetical protein ABIK62_06025, partial [candidate division WOR-3 bacterium]
GIALEVCPSICQDFALLQVSCPVTIQSPPASLSVRDAAGRLVRSCLWDVGCLRLKLDLTGLPAGLYLARLNTRLGSAQARFLVLGKSK